MPVIPKRSRKFYETSGDDIANAWWSGSTRWI